MNINYLIKTYVRLLKFIKVVVDFALFIILIPIYAILVLHIAIVGRSTKKQKFVIFCGLEHVIQKSLFRAMDLQKNGLNVKYCSFEQSSNSLNEVKNDIIGINTFVSIDIFLFLKLILQHNPVYIELYYEGTGIRQVFYALISRCNGSVTAAIFRGGELRYYVQNERIVKTYLCFISANLSHMLLYRELYMKKYIDKFIIDKRKVFHDFNKVNVKELKSNNKTEKQILFLNTLKEVRRPEILIHAFPLVLKEHPDSKLLLVGAQNKMTYEKFNKLLDELGISDNAEILPWTSSPEIYYENASVFVLPADLVYCNYSLLESMERGLPAVVANVIDADRIIKHGVNGFIAEQTPEDFAKYISILLSNKDMRLKMGKEARITIIDRFNSKDRMAPIYEFIRRRYPYALKD